MQQFQFDLSNTNYLCTWRIRRGWRRRRKWLNSIELFGTKLWCIVIESLFIVFLPFWILLKQPNRMFNFSYFSHVASMHHVNVHLLELHTCFILFLPKHSLSFFFVFVFVQVSLSILISSFYWFWIDQFSRFKLRLAHRMSSFKRRVALFATFIRNTGANYTKCKYVMDEKGKYFEFFANRLIIIAYFRVGNCKLSFTFSFSLQVSNDDWLQMFQQEAVQSPDLSNKGKIECSIDAHSSVYFCVHLMSLAWRHQASLLN